MKMSKERSIYIKRQFWNSGKCNYHDSMTYKGNSCSKRVFKIVSVLFIMLFFSISSKAQDTLDYKLLDKKTYKYYLDKNWEGIIHYGVAAKKAGFDTYYINLRTGIAYLNLEDNYRSIYYLKRAIENNSQSDLARQYLYQCYINLGRKSEAYEVYKEMKFEIREKLKLEDLKAFDYIYLEGAQKYANNDSIGTTNFIQAGIGHNISRNLDIYHSYSYSDEDKYWGNYNQNQYYLKAVNYLGKGYNLKLAFQYINSKSNVEFTNNFQRVQTQMRSFIGYIRYDSIFDEIDEVNFGKLTENTYAFSISIGKTGRRLEFYPYLTYINANIENRSTLSQMISTQTKRYIDPFNTILINEESVHKENIDEKTSENIFQYGFDLSYILPILNNSVKIGSWINVNTSDRGTYIIPSPYANIKLFPSLWLNTDYYYGNTYYVSEKDLSLLNNSPDLSKQKISVMLNKYFKPNINLFLLYQYEEKEEKFFNFTYCYNTALLGLKIQM